MKSLSVTSQVYLTSEFSEACTMFFKRGQSLLNLLLKSMKVSCLVMIQTLTQNVFSTRTPIVLKLHMMWCLMRLMAQEEQVDHGLVDDEEATCDAL
jgi:hypothetical protein